MTNVTFNRSASPRPLFPFHLGMQQLDARLSMKPDGAKVSPLSAYNWAFQYFPNFMRLQGAKALKSSIYKAELSVADMDRQHYETYPLTLARHPSENEERMMVCILAFARHAGTALSFDKGISDNSEPDLWTIGDTGAIDIWIELGQVDEKRLRQACGRARQVIIYTYNGAASDIWWQQNQTRIQRFDNLSMFNVPPASVEALGARRNEEWA
jgi:uncharacterized protein YaeQ